MIIDRLDIITESARPGSWRAVKPADVITPAYIDDLINHGGAKDPGPPHPEAAYGDRLKFPFHYEDSMPEFHNDAGEYPEQFAHLKQLPYEDAIQHKDYRDAITKVSVEHFQRAQKVFKEEFKYVDGRIRAERMISITPTLATRLARGGSLGIYWTYAGVDDRSYWGNQKDGRTPVFMVAAIPESSVDWIQTFVQNMDWFQGMSEYELRLFPGSPIRLLEINGQQVDPNGKWTA